MLASAPELDSLLHTLLSLPEPSRDQCLDVLFPRRGTHAFDFPGGPSICLAPTMCQAL